MLLNPAITPEIAERFIASGASPVATGDALFRLVFGGAAVKGDTLDTSGAFGIGGAPFACTDNRAVTAP